jgi:predicted RNA-binding protein with RPS1 domain
MTYIGLKLSINEYNGYFGHGGRIHGIACGREQCRGGERALGTVVRAASEDGSPAVEIREEDGTFGDSDVKNPNLIPAAWEKAIELLQSGESFTTDIRGVNKSGVLIRVGKLSGFIPYKLMNGYTLSSIDKALWTEKLVGRPITVKVTQVVVPERRLICSEKAVMLENAASKLKVGDVIEGQVASLHTFGAFVEIAKPEEHAGTEVILPVRELSWDWVSSVGAVVSKGDKVAVKVVDVNTGPQCKVVVSLKRMEGDPLQETLDNVMPLDAAAIADEKTVPVSIPQGVEDILDELSKEPGVGEVTLGRRVEERRTVSQDLELWMSKEAVVDGFNLVARAGRTVQEIHVRTEMNADSMRGTVQRVLKRVN